MDTLADSPIPGKAPDPAIQTAAVASAVTVLASESVPDQPRWSAESMKEVLVAVYAYGLLGFGLFFPLVLAAWKVFFSPDA